MSQQLDWSPTSWQKKEIRQIPEYEDLKSLEQIKRQIQSYPGLVSVEEIQQLRKLLSRAHDEEIFLIQGGDCAESFDNFSTESISKTFKELLKMAMIFSFAGEKQVIRIGRFAGQYAKPRSKPTETRGDVTLPVYRGDIFNSAVFDSEARKADPARMQQAYFHSASVLNFLRSHTNAKYTDLGTILEEMLHFLQDDPNHSQYQKLVDKTRKGLEIVQSSATGTDGISMPRKPLDFFSSHESLLLDYEASLLREDRQHGFFAASAHMLWIGDRTRFLESAHVEFLRGVLNPIGIKVGPTTVPSELIQIIQALNPKNEKGKIVLISRMGKDKVQDFLPKVISQVHQSGQHVLWTCDPMHGNTVTSEEGLKTRKFDDIYQETTDFFHTCQKSQVRPSGIHLEMTGAYVTECLGGKQKVDLTQNYQSLCDPRLNADQAIELAFAICQLLQG